MELLWNVSTGRYQLHRTTMPSLDTQKLDAINVQSDELSNKLKELDSSEWGADIKFAIAAGDVDFIRRLWPALRPEHHDFARKMLCHAILDFLHNLPESSFHPGVGVPESCQVLLRSLFQINGVDQETHSNRLRIFFRFFCINNPPSFLAS